MLVLVQREAGERLAAGAGDKAYGIPSVKVAYYATAEVVGYVGPDGVPAQAAGRVGARARSSATRRPRRRRRPRAAVRPGAGRLRAAAQDAAPLPRRARRRRRPSRPPASTRGQGRGARPGRLGPSRRVRARWPRSGVRCPGQGDAVAARHRRAGRRLPPARRRDGHGRPRRRARRRPDGDGLDVVDEAGLGSPCPTTPRTSCAGRCALAGRTAHVRLDQAHPRRRRARRRLRRRRRGAALGRRARPRSSPPRLGADVAFCVVGGRARVHGHRRGASSRCRTSTARSPC